MASLDNASFETPGAGPGLAQSWTGARSTAAEDVALFDDLGNSKPYEDYTHGWSQNEAAKSEFESDDLVDATMNPETYEDNWALPATVVPADPRWNHHSLSVLSDADVSAATFLPGAKAQEDYEADWQLPASLGDNDDSKTLTTWVTSDATFADASTVNDFEDGYNNSTSEEAWNPAGFVYWGVSPVTYETFESSWTLTLP